MASVVVLLSVWAVVVWSWAGMWATASWAADERLVLETLLVVSVTLVCRRALHRRASWPRAAAGVACSDGCHAGHGAAGCTACVVQTVHFYIATFLRHSRLFDLDMDVARIAPTRHSGERVLVDGFAIRVECCKLRRFLRGSESRRGMRSVLLLLEWAIVDWRRWRGGSVCLSIWIRLSRGGIDRVGWCGFALHALVS